MKKVNIAYIISFVDKSSLFEWTAKLLNKDKINLIFILLNTKESPFEKILMEQGINVYRINYSGKKDIPSAIIKTIKILKKEKIKIIHAHLFDASIVGLIAAKIARIKKRIHTRHNATLHHDYHPWAVKYDKLINFLSTDIVAISENVKNILVQLEGANENKIHLIHHGFHLDEFNQVPEDRIKKIKDKYNLNDKSKPIIGVISRYIHWKGLQYIIPAFVEFQKKYPHAHFIFANASGPFSHEINKMQSQLQKDSYTEIKFEEDIFALYKSFDIFVHTPIDEKSEAYGQVYVESMASGLPTIITMSGIAPEYAIHKKNTLVVPFKNSSAIYQALISLNTNEILKNQIADEGKKSVYRLFIIDEMIKKMEGLYE